MSKKRNQLKMTKIRHSSLDLAELADSDNKKKHVDVLSRAKNKLLNLSDALKYRKPDENQNKPLAKSMTQCTLDYFFKQPQNRGDQNIYQKPGSKHSLQKQSSVGSYPQIRVSSFDSDLEDGDDLFSTISRSRPATVCVDRPSVDRRSDAEALALERPRKKLSFKEPEVEKKKKPATEKRISDAKKLPNRTILSNNHVANDIGKNKFQNTLKMCEKILKPPSSNGSAKSASDNNDKNFSLGKGIQSIAGLGISVVTNGVNRTPSFEDTDLESQAMRIVRTVGQAFEVCHKLSIVAPEDNYDDEQDTTLTQDLLSDRLSDVASDKPKKDITSEGANSDKNSLPTDESSLKESYLDSSIKPSKPPAHLDLLPPPPLNSSSSRKSPLQAETYSSPHSDGFGSSSNPGSTSNPLPPPGSALSSHHEIQLLREQLEQQRQQTQAAMAQLQLAREQLQAEQTARMEAQARTHQLLVHNRELLDHIAALVAHLQGGDKAGQQSTPPHMTMPQQPQPPQDNQHDQLPQLDPNLVLQALGLTSPGVFENRPVAATCQSPLRNTFNPGGGGIFNFGYTPTPLQMEQNSFENQLLQRIQALSAYQSQYQYGYPQGLPLLNQGMYNLNNASSFPMQNPPQYGPYATLPRTFTNIENRLNTSRHSEPRQIPSMYQQYDTTQKDMNQPTTNQSAQSLSVSSMPPRRLSSINLPQENMSSTSTNQRLQIQTDKRLQRGCSPMPQTSTATTTTSDNEQSQFIKPLSQVGTLTTTDSEGRVRVIVPVPPDNEEEDLLSNLRISDELRLMNGPGVARSSSERVPNRSELMSQVQRTMWARHTTK